jgi:hypothetical protein
VLFAVFSLQIQAQVKIGVSAGAANPNAMLEIEATNKGLLLPRLSLVATTSAAPLTSFVKGMLVYDTATVNDITPGMYYSDGAKWIKVNSGASATGTVVTATNAWNLAGNSGTDPNTNFLGTTDNKDVVFKTNSLERVRFTKDGWVGIGTVTPKAALEIKGQLIIDTLTLGDINFNKVLVADAQGKVKAVSPSVFAPSIQKKLLLAAYDGQTNFTTPATITDADKIMLYRNGVMIAFNILNSNTIVSEIACTQYDEIRIIQIL